MLGVWSQRDPTWPLRSLASWSCKHTLLAGACRNHREASTLGVIAPSYSPTCFRCLGLCPCQPRRQSPKQIAGAWVGPQGVAARGERTGAGEVRAANISGSRAQVRWYLEHARRCPRDDCHAPTDCAGGVYIKRRCESTIEILRYVPGYWILSSRIIYRVCSPNLW